MLIVGVENDGKAHWIGPRRGGDGLLSGVLARFLDAVEQGVALTLQLMVLLKGALQLGLELLGAETTALP